jgi:hypothetical protein
MTTRAEEAEMHRMGNVCWHSSDEDSGPDVGISVGLGDAMLFVGEVPGLFGGWSMCVYLASGDRLDIAETVNGDEARVLVEILALKMRLVAEAREALTPKEAS